MPEFPIVDLTQDLQPVLDSELSPLDVDQQRRVKAVRVAAVQLRAGMFGTARVGSVDEIIRLADWLLTGEKTGAEDGDK